jgi:hypothetical protein
LRNPHRHGHLFSLIFHAVDDVSGGTGSYENKLRVEDRAAHDWYRFVLSFPPHLVRTYLERFGVMREMRALDPFCGTGTTLVECKKLGIAGVGIERNPVAYFASRSSLIGPRIRTSSSPTRRELHDTRWRPLRMMG